MFVLIHSPLVGASSLAPTARALEARGASCRLATLALPDGGIPAWRDCPRHLIEQVPSAEGAVLVGHSAGCLLAAHLAPTLGAAGVLFLDGRIPPTQGRVPPADDEFLATVRGLAGPDGRLPRWSEWWGRDIFAGATLAPEHRERFETEQPSLAVSWFDDSFEMGPWTAHACGYLQTSALFAPQADQAEARGWPTIRLGGSHLHPLLEPDATADALLAIRPVMGASSSSTANDGS